MNLEEVKLREKNFELIVLCIFQFSQSWSRMESKRLTSSNFKILDQVENHVANVNALFRNQMKNS